MCVGCSMSFHVENMSFSLPSLMITLGMIMFTLCMENPMPCKM